MIDRSNGPASGRSRFKHERLIHSRLDGSVGTNVSGSWTPFRPLQVWALAAAPTSNASPKGRALSSASRRRRDSRRLR